jgi:hypothetical protein
MPYELFDNQAVRNFDSPRLTISSGRIAFNADAGHHLATVGARHIHILWDAAACKIALQPVAAEDALSFKLSLKKGRRAGVFSAQSFLNHIQWNATSSVGIDARWNQEEKILEAALPKEYVGARGKNKISSRRQ